MNITNKIISIVLIFIICIIIYNCFNSIPQYYDLDPSKLQESSFKESFRGRRRRRRPHYNRRWWGDHWGYRYRPPPVLAPPRLYPHPWYNPWYWFSPVCKNGCTLLGNNRWGCQYPGNSVNDCIFASDCRGC